MRSERNWRPGKPRNFVFHFESEGKQLLESFEQKLFDIFLKDHSGCPMEKK